MRIKRASFSADSTYFIFSKYISSPFSKWHLRVLYFLSAVAVLAILLAFYDLDNSLQRSSSDRFALQEQSRQEQNQLEILTTPATQNTDQTHKHWMLYD